MVAGREIEWGTRGQRSELQASVPIGSSVVICSYAGTLGLEEGIAFYANIKFESLFCKSTHTTFFQEKKLEFSSPFWIPFVLLLLCSWETMDS